MVTGHFKGQRIGPYSRKGAKLTPLRELRLELHLTQRQAAAALRMGESTYRTLEARNRALTPQHEAQLRDFRFLGGGARATPKAPVADQIKTAEAVRSQVNWTFPSFTPAADAS